MNSETRQAYYELFTSFFTSVKTLAIENNQELRFRHIYGEGIGLLVADMDTKQAGGMYTISMSNTYLMYLGWGDFLHEFYPQYSSDYHRQQTVVWCLVHFNRGIDTCARDDALKERMKELPYVESMAVSVLYTHSIRVLHVVGVR